MRQRCPLSLVMGGSASGKSRFAEDYLCELAHAGGKSPCLVYLATLEVRQDPENEARVRRHRRERRGKNFETFEVPRNLADAVAGLPQDAFVLLDCLDNLLANELFPPQDLIPAEQPRTAAAGILSAIDALGRHVSRCVLVSNQIFNDLPLPDLSAGTRQFMHELAVIQQTIARWEQTEVIRVTAGLPLKLKSLTD